MFFQLSVQVVEHDTGFDDDGLLFNIERQDFVEVLRDVDYKAAVNSLPTLRGATAARRHDAANLAGNHQRSECVVHGARHHNAARDDLVE
mgnify:CR=1 FL=1